MIIWYVGIKYVYCVIHLYENRNPTDRKIQIGYVFVLSLPLLNNIKEIGWKKWHVRQTRFIKNTEFEKLRLFNFLLVDIPQETRERHERRKYFNLSLLLPSDSHNCYAQFDYNTFRRWFIIATETVRIKVWRIFYTKCLIRFRSIPILWPRV